MARRPIKNVPASVHARLRNLARSREEYLNDVYQRYTAERFLYRLGTSPVSSSFTLKGATLFVVWGGDTFRGTRDVDLLRSGPLESLHDDLATIGAQPCPDDGVEFGVGAADIRLTPLPVIRTQGAVRARIKGLMGRVRLHLQIDVGFGELPYPDRESRTLPVLLDQPRPTIWTYRRESHIAEKFHAMVQHGHSNSRMKDLWDIAALAARLPFHGPTLQKAIRHVFGHRGTILDDGVSTLLSPSFFREQERKRMWAGFLDNALIFAEDGPTDLSDVGGTIRRFLKPVYASIVHDTDLPYHWPPGGPWQQIGDEAGGEMLDATLGRP